MFNLPPQPRKAPGLFPLGSVGMHRGHRAWDSPGTPKHHRGWDNGMRGYPCAGARSEERALSLSECWDLASPASPASVLHPDPTSLIPHHGPCSTLLPISQSCILHPASHILHSTEVLSITSCNMQPTSRIPHPSSSILHLESFILHSTPTFQCSIPAQNLNPAFQCCIPALDPSTASFIPHLNPAFQGSIPVLHSSPLSYISILYPSSHIPVLHPAAHSCICDPISQSRILYPVS